MRQLLERHRSMRQLAFVFLGCLSLSLLACNLTSQILSPAPSPQTNAEIGVDEALTAGPCPLEDESLCAFVAKLEPAIEAGDIDLVLENTQAFDCATHGSAGPGFNPSTDCGQDEFCTQHGALQGGGGCTPLSRIRATWANNSAPPIRVRGIVVPTIPGLGLENVEVLNGPAILVSTGDAEWDWIFFAERVGEAWQLSALLLQRREAAKYQTPDEIVIPWP